MCPEAVLLELAVDYELTGSSGDAWTLVVWTNNVCQGSQDHWLCGPIMYVRVHRTTGCVDQQCMSGFTGPLVVWTNIVCQGSQDHWLCGPTMYVRVHRTTDSLTVTSVSSDMSCQVSSH